VSRLAVGAVALFENGSNAATGCGGIVEVPAGLSVAIDWNDRASAGSEPDG